MGGEKEGKESISLVILLRDLVPQSLALENVSIGF